MSRTEGATEVAKSSQQKGLRLLLAEDEDTLRMILAQILEDHGFSVTPARDGEEAWRLWDADPTPLVLTDIMMPGISGLELIERVKKRDAEAVVVVMTSNASLDSATRALRAGAYDFVVKPFDELEIPVAVMERAADKRRLMNENRRLLEDLKRKTVELNQANEALQKLADTLKEFADRDGLTGLLNHRAFREALVRELSVAEREDRTVSLVFMDVDHFKRFNDTNGHLMGDELLKDLGALLRDGVPPDAHVARYGGEELVVIAPGLDKEGGLGLAEKLRHRVEDHPFEGRESQPKGRVTLSLGVATYPADGPDATALLRHADQAVYDAKDRGRNNVCG